MASQFKFKKSTTVAATVSVPNIGEFVRERAARSLARLEILVALAHSSKIN